MTTQTDFRGRVRLVQSRRKIRVGKPSWGWHRYYTTKVVRHMEWRWEVFNAQTGDVIASDDAYGEVTDVTATVAQEVEKVRDAWTRGYLRRRFA